MMHFLPDLFLAITVGFAYIGGIWCSALLGLIVAGSLLGALQKYGNQLDRYDRISMAGLAGALVMTTPAIFFSGATPFDGWSTNLSRVFLAMICLKRWGVPFWWKVVGDKRQKDQVVASGRAVHLHDKLQDRL